MCKGCTNISWYALILFEGNMSERLYENSRKVMIEHADMGTNRFDKKYQRWYQPYLQIKGRKGTWINKRFKYKKVKGEL